MPTPPPGELTDWHAAPIEGVLNTWQTDANEGLSQVEAQARLQQYGSNRLPEPRKHRAWQRFLLQFHNVLIYVLLIAGGIKLLLGLWIDGSVILAVVVLNAVLGFVQESKAEKALDAIANLLPTEARTLRAGKLRLLPATELVPGDIVHLESGDKIPADLRLIMVKNLRTEEAALTGESVPIDKGIAPVAVNAVLGDRLSMAYSGTLVASGRAIGVVVATGAQTELGKINALMISVNPLQTPLLRQIERFGYLITAIILALCTLVFAYGHWVAHLPLVFLFQAVVGIAVSMIPEGLPALITITLAIGVQRMAQRNAIIRRLPAVETLGAVSRICSDKTGTLTRMEMMAMAAVTARGEVRVTGSGYAPEGVVLRQEVPIDPATEPELRWLARAGLLCNDAEWLTHDGHWQVQGDPTEGALHPFASKLGLNRPAEQALYPRLDSLPFESQHQFMATLHAQPSGVPLLLIKGAPEVIFRHCTRQLQGEDHPAPLDAFGFEQAAERLAQQGQRVLALAMFEYKTPPPNDLSAADLPQELCLIGLVGLLDPPRPEAIDAIRVCHEGGVRVTMITGDHRSTAAAVAHMLGIGDGKTALTGQEIEQLDDAALKARAECVDVFARASPEHKLRLVQAMQAHGAVVAMTGDGVNDAPALKKADIGVAMGKKGTEVTKEAADMVLADDNFASIAAAVKEGRTVYNNIEKTLLFVMPTNVAQGAVILVAVIFGFLLPITAPQILWVNMITSVTLGVIIAFESHESAVMQRPPRRPDQALIDGFGLWRILFIGTGLLLLTLIAFFWMQATGASLELARSVAVNTLVFGQIAYLLNSRSKLEPAFTRCAVPANPALWPGIGAVLVLQALFTYAPPLQALFATAAIPAPIWGMILLGATLLFLLVETEKWLLRRWQRRARSSAPPN